MLTAMKTLVKRVLHSSSIQREDLGLFHPIMGVELHTAMLMPIVLPEGCVGVLYLCNRTVDESFTSQDAHVLAFVGAQLSALFARSKRKLQSLAQDRNELQLQVHAVHTSGYDCIPKFFGVEVSTK